MTIKQKQWQLYFLGYYFAGIDGIWGPASEAATKAFQKDFGLEVDGIYGPLTEAKSVEVVGGIQKAVGTDVDGLAGPNTVVATITYQRNNGLSPDGIAGPLTRGKIAEGEQVNWEEVKYFTRDEFRCPCGKCGGFPVEPHKNIVTAADDMREALGKPVIIVPPDGHSGGSGVRCQEYNDSLSGSVPDSRHVQGKAVDFSAPGVPASKIEAHLARAKANGTIRYWYKICAGSYHMDVD